MNPPELWDETPLPLKGDDLHVLDLLQRLESENATSAPPAAAAPLPLEEILQQQPTKWAQWDPEVPCAACRSLNPVDQKFCGYCGASLQANAAPSTEVGHAQKVRVQEPRPPEPLPEPPAFVFEQATVESPVFPQPRPELRAREDSDLEFLRYKTQGVEEPSGVWRLPIALLALVLAGAAGYYFYTHRAPSASAGLPAETPSSSVAAPEPAASQPIPDVPAAASAPKVTGKIKTSAPLKAAEQTAVTEATQRTRDPLTPPADAPVAVGGREELAQAERLLAPASRDSAEAAKWLWKAVGKENGHAVLLLSDLYAKGDGVEKNCDQARLLLVIAAKKGNADAASRLRSFDSAGCQ